MTITAQTLVKNEARFLWYAVISVAQHVDKILLWDTGSTDDTIKIAEEIKKVLGSKVDCQKFVVKTPEDVTKLRQKMLDKTETDWFLVVDGDEVWWEDSIKNVVKAIKRDGSRLDYLVSPYYTLVGDIYHYQEEQAGRYKIHDWRGHINIRAINKSIPGLHVKGTYPLEGYYDKEEVIIQERAKTRAKFVEDKCLHLTHLTRSSGGQDNNVAGRSKKLKYELGREFPGDFYYPEVFFRPRPAIVPSPWQKMTTGFWAKSLIETPLRKIKRRILRR